MPTALFQQIDLKHYVGARMGLSCTGISTSYAHIYFFCLQDQVNNLRPQQEDLWI